MNNIQCVVVNKGVRCETFISVSDPVSDKCSFICKNHNRAEQVRAAKRSYDPIKDEADKDVHFQDCQFDPNLYGGAAPDFSIERDDTSDITF